MNRSRSCKKKHLATKLTLTRQPAVLAKILLLPAACRVQAVFITIFMCMLVFVCHHRSSSTHTDLQRQSFIPAFHSPSAVFPSVSPPCCSPVWPQINRVHSAQTHSVMIFNRWLQEESSGECHPLRLCIGARSVQSNMCMHLHTQGIAHRHTHTQR